MDSCVVCATDGRSWWMHGDGGQRAAREKGGSDLKATAEAEAAQEAAEAAITRAQEAERKAKAPHEDDEEHPITLNAVFKAEGFGMLEAMSQVRRLVVLLDPVLR